MRITFVFFKWENGEVVPLLRVADKFFTYRYS